MFRLLRSRGAAPAAEEEEVEEEDEDEEDEAAAAATDDEVDKVDDAGLLDAEAFSSARQLLRLSLRRLRLPLASQQAARGAAAESGGPRASGRRESIDALALRQKKLCADLVFSSASFFFSPLRRLWPPPPPPSHAAAASARSHNKKKKKKEKTRVDSPRISMGTSPLPRFGDLARCSGGPSRRALSTARGVAVLEWPRGGGRERQMKKEQS